MVRGGRGGGRIYLDLKCPVVISEVAYKLVPTLTTLSDPFIQIAINWLRASFMAQNQKKLIAGPIRTRRELLAAIVTT